jgi:hypothetical protein
MQIKEQSNSLLLLLSISTTSTISAQSLLTDDKSLQDAPYISSLKYHYNGISASFLRKDLREDPGGESTSITFLIFVPSCCLLI